MKKGFTLIEIVLCTTFISIIVLSFMIIFLNINNTFDKMNKNSQNYEKLKYICQSIENVMNTIDVEQFEITKNQLVINDFVIIQYNNKTLKVYQYDVTLCEEIVENFTLSEINDKLFKIEIAINDKQLERYYYVGSN